MNLLVISHKETWMDLNSPTGYATIGGFPFQMRALSDLFDATTLLVLQRTNPMPPGATSFVGHNLVVKTLPEPKGHDFLRKVRLFAWVPRHMSTIWKQVHQADAVHIPLPGDLGTIGMVIALLQKKPLFIRHCGRWGIPSSRFDALLQKFLVRIATKKRLVWATGASDLPPSSKNPAIEWIFSSALTEAELQALPASQPWQPGQPLKLVSVGSLLPGKNFAALIDALPAIRSMVPGAELSLVGSGRLLPELQALSAANGVASDVYFLGNLSHTQVLKVLADAHIFVFPTLYEGFPKALLEAMACGLPVIASPVSVIPKLLSPEAGVLLAGFQASDIVVAVKDLVEHPSKMALLGQNARMVAREYTLESWARLIDQRLRSAWGMALRANPEPAPEKESNDRHS